MKQQSAVQRFRGIPALAGIAEKINQEFEIPPFPDAPFAETGTYRPLGWGMIDRSTGKRLRPLAKKKAAKKQSRFFSFLSKSRSS
jgi:hypothetical protein